MARFLIGHCQRCGAAVSYFAPACPSCHGRNLPNPVAAAIALAAVLFAGGLAVLGWPALHSDESPQGEVQAKQAPEAKETTADPAGTGTDDYGWLVQAMADCDVQAKHRLDTLHFLIIPVTTTAVALPGWTPNAIGTIGDAATLLHSSDAVIGLRNRALALYKKPLTFVVADPQTKAVYKWKPAVGVTALTTPDTGLSHLTLGFEIRDAAKEIEWGPTITLTKGTCYWINPLVLSGARSG
jgi:hypothetical protein